MRKLLLPLVSLLLFLPNVALAHQNGNGGFLSGLSHPILGFDHLLAMLSVGIVSVQIGGKAIWTIPLTFVAVMLLGGIMGMAGIEVFSIEAGIAFSVFALGIAITADKKLPIILSMIIVGFFAIFHGYAHGTEMPGLANPIFYAAGFIIGTACIHIMGITLGFIAKRSSKGLPFLKYIGAAIAGIGFHLLILVS